MERIGGSFGPTPRLKLVPPINLGNPDLHARAITHMEKRSDERHRNDVSDSPDAIVGAADDHGGRNGRVSRKRNDRPDCRSRRTGRRAADQAPLSRAYGQDVPSSARFHTVTLTVLGDETNQPLSDTEVIVLNYVDLKDYSFKTDTRGQLRFIYPYVGDAPLLNIELRKNGYVPLRHGWGFKNTSEKPVDELAIRLRAERRWGALSYTWAISRLRALPS